MPKIKTAVMIFFLLIAACPVSAHTEHDFCVSNNTGETLEVCLYPKDPLYYDDTNTCFFVKNDNHCDLRNISFEDACRYDLCAYGADSQNDYGCVRNSSCTGVGYTFETGRAYVCGNSYCRADVEDEDDSDTVIYCFIAASSFDKKTSLVLELFQNIYYSVKDTLKSVCENKTQR